MKVGERYLLNVKNARCIVEILEVSYNESGPLCICVQVIDESSSWTMGEKCRSTIGVTWSPWVLLSGQHAAK
jgi:hypothetical protein